MEILKPFRVELFGQFLMNRQGAAVFELKELAKRVMRAFVPFRRLRPQSSKPSAEVESDPRYAVEPVGDKTAAIFVAVGRI